MIYSQMLIVFIFVFINVIAPNGKHLNMVK